MHSKQRLNFQDFEVANGRVMLFSVSFNTTGTILCSIIPPLPDYTLKLMDAP